MKRVGKAKCAEKSDLGTVPACSYGLRVVYPWRGADLAIRGSGPGCCHPGQKLHPAFCKVYQANIGSELCQSLFGTRSRPDLALFVGDQLRAFCWIQSRV